MSGHNWVKTGNMDGTAALITITTGYKPRRVEVFNAAGLAKAIKTDTMAGDSAIKTITDGTMTFAAATITIISNGFTIGTDGDLNVAGEALHWIAQTAENE